jgi:glycosyltransferase involved in cell wall biosynthesis
MDPTSQKGDEAATGERPGEPLTVSVVMPCLDEQKTLPACIAAAQRGIEVAGITGEVIVVDNGSRDRSATVAEAAGAHVVRCERRGYGNALRAGFAAARGRFILMGDADQSYDFSELPRFWKEIEAGHQLVMGTRLRGHIAPGAMPRLHRYLGNPALSFILRLLFRAPVSDAHCGLRAFTKDAVSRMDLRTGGMELASEIVIKAAAAGLRITEIPITLHRDARDRPPHLRSWRDGWRHLRYMLMMAPNWLFFLPGFAALLLGAVLIGALLPGPLRFGAVTLDVHTMLVGMALVLLGVYLALLGCFVKAFSYTERLGSGGSAFAAALRRVKLEHGLLAGGVLVGIGLAGDAWFLAQWLAEGAGRLDTGATLRPAILYTTLLVAGLQVVFGAFFLSMLGISRGDYVGDYTAEPK